MSWVAKILWQWPDGLIWKITNQPTLASKRNKYALFIALMRPRPADTILDVGIAPYTYRGTNFLEQWYPHPEKIVALANDKVERFKDFMLAFPRVKLIFGDGKLLPFPENHFNIVFCNAVVEHVGNRDEQRKFIHELVRISRKAFITTPDYCCPIETHTLIPFAHWLPMGFRFWIYQKFGRGFFADINHLNLLSGKELMALFPTVEGFKVSLYRQKILGLPTNLVVIAEKI
jgi:hypothetical protein